MERDECKHCIVRGDISKCKETPCNHHENWYAIEQQKKIDNLKQFIIECRDDVLYPLAHEETELGKIACIYGSETVRFLNE